jgi:hypothetical protein
MEGCPKSSRSLNPALKIDSVTRSNGYVSCEVPGSKAFLSESLAAGVTVLCIVAFGLSHMSENHSGTDVECQGFDE